MPTTEFKGRALKVDASTINALRVRPVSKTGRRALCVDAIMTSHQRTEEARMDGQSINRKTWKQHYYQLAIEHRAQTEKNVHLIEEALFLRWQELAGDPNHHNERNEMKRASANLLRVKTQRLGWPSIRF
jgi:hypothetical protein